LLRARRSKKLILQNKKSKENSLSVLFVFLLFPQSSFLLFTCITDVCALEEIEKDNLIMPVKAERKWTERGWTKSLRSTIAKQLIFFDACTAIVFAEAGQNEKKQGIGGIDCIVSTHVSRAGTS